MRRKVTPERIHEFMRELSAASTSPGTVYLAEGGTSLLLGIRETTIDLDLRLDPEPKGAFEAIAALKNKLDINVELASPLDFIPAPADWREKSTFIDRIGSLDFYHFDLRLQALAKIER